MGKKGDGKGGGEQREVVDAEVAEVLAQAGGGIGEGIGAGEGGAVEELPPGATVVEGAAGRVG